MAEGAPAVVVMARAPRPGLVHRGLEPLLGAEGCAALQSALLAAAAAWAGRVACERVYIAYEPADARDELTELIGPAAAFFPQNGEGIASRTAAACAHVFTSGERPLLVVWPLLARLADQHAHSALEDLGQGCEVVLGPLFDGGLYLIGVSRPTRTLFGLTEQAWRSPQLVTAAVAAAHDAGHHIGLLRAERALHRPADVRAALADPLLDPVVRRVLRRALALG